MHIFVVYLERLGKYEDVTTGLITQCLNNNEAGRAEAEKLAKIHPDAKVYVGREVHIIPQHINWS